MKKKNVPEDLIFKGITQAYWKSLYSNHRQLCKDKCEKCDFIELYGWTRHAWKVTVPLE